MPLRVKNVRAERRYALPTDLRAEIEFDVPDGGHYRLPLVNISVLGLAFFIPEPILEFGAGIMLNDAQIHVDSQIHVGSLVIRGNLVLRHTPREHPSDHKCGAQFYPASDRDRNELVSLLSRLKSLLQLRRT
jgi:hypothetical protein